MGTPEDTPPNKFYVYEHWRTDKDQCFYVGKGFGNRAYSMRSRNRRHRFIQNRADLDGFRIEVRIVADCLSEDDAFWKEKELIQKWKGFGVPIVNVTLGGEGAVGLVHTDESRAKMSRSRRGKRKAPEHAAKLVLRLFSPEAREKANKKLAAILRSPEFIERVRAKNIGQKRSAAAKDAMRKAWTPERKEAHRIRNIALNQMLAERRAQVRAKTGAGAQQSK